MENCTIRHSKDKSFLIVTISTNENRYYSYTLPGMNTVGRIASDELSGDVEKDFTFVRETMKNLIENACKNNEKTYKKEMKHLDRTAKIVYKTFKNSCKIADRLHNFDVRLNGDAAAEKLRVYQFYLV